MKAMIITRDSELHTEIAAQGAARIPALSVADSRPGTRAALERMAETPELIILDAAAIDSGEGEGIERLVRHYAGASVMLLMRGREQDVLIRAMRAGVREVLELPLVHRAFHEAMDRIDLASGVANMRDGKVLAFIACKGGSGATFLSTNFAYALASLAARKVLMIDLHGQFGDAALYVSDQKPSMTLADVCGQIARIDGAFLESCTVQVAPNFGVLAAAESETAPRPDQMETLLRIARQHYDYIVLDVGRQIDALSLRALDEADTIYPVLQLGLPDIRDGRRLLDIFRSLGYPIDQVRLLVNRYEKGGRLRLQDVQNALGAPVLHTIPNDYVAVTDSVNQGVPVLQIARTSAVAKSLAELVELVTARRVPENKGLFDRLFGRAGQEV